MLPSVVDAPFDGLLPLLSNDLAAGDARHDYFPDVTNGIDVGTGFVVAVNDRPSLTLCACFR